LFKNRPNLSESAAQKGIFFFPIVAHIIFSKVFYAKNRPHAYPRLRHGHILH